VVWLNQKPFEHDNKAILNVKFQLATCQALCKLDTSLKDLCTRVCY